MRTIFYLIGNERLSHEIDDMFAALSQAKLVEYMNDDSGFFKRFGLRTKMDDKLSVIFYIINGMANEIERLRNENRKTNLK